MLGPTERALCAKLSYYGVFLYAKYPHRVVLYMQSILIMHYFITTTYALLYIMLGPFHANLSVTTQNWPFSVLGFWDNNTGICAGAMPYRRDFTATTRI